MNQLTKYVLTFKNKDGLRVLAHDNNSRNGWDDKKKGVEWLKMMYKNNSPETIRQIFGEKPKFKILLVTCYPGGDATRTVFND